MHECRKNLALGWLSNFNWKTGFCYICYIIYIYICCFSKCMHVLCSCEPLLSKLVMNVCCLFFAGGLKMQLDPNQPQLQPKWWRVTRRPKWWRVTRRVNQLGLDPNNQQDHRLQSVGASLVLPSHSLLRPSRPSQFQRKPGLLTNLKSRRRCLQVKPALQHHQPGLDHCPKHGGHPRPHLQERKVMMMMMQAGNDFAMTSHKICSLHPGEWGQSFSWKKYRGWSWLVSAVHVELRFCGRLWMVMGPASKIVQFSERWKTCMFALMLLLSSLLITCMDLAL